jgi:hypothetical protein
MMSGFPKYSILRSRETVFIPKKYIADFLLINLAKTPKYSAISRLLFCAKLQNKDTATTIYIVKKYTQYDIKKYSPN